MAWTRASGRSQAVQLTCDKWRDEQGTLWKPNRLAPVDLPALKLAKQNWVIGNVVFRKDDGGTHADLTLMPPEAFSVQPSTLNIFDWEINAAVSQPAQTGPGGLLGHI